MTISASLLSFQSSKTLPHPNTRADKLAAQRGLEIGRNTSSSMGFTDGIKQINRKNKLNFFRRVSVRISRSGSITSKKGNSSSRLSHSDRADPSFERPHPPPSSPLQSSPPVPKSTVRKSLDVRTSFDSSATESFQNLKDLIKSPPDSLASTKSRSSRASLFFWRRMSQTQDSMIREEELQDGLHESGSPEDTIQTSISSDGAPSSITSSEMCETMCSTTDTTETSVASVEDAQNDLCGIAGIGVRNRHSIALNSLPVRYSISPNLSPGIIANKLPYHPAMRYAPSNSSPLSSRSHSPSEMTVSKSTMSNLNPAHRPAQSRSSTPSINSQSHLHVNHRLSTGRLNIVPNHQSCIASEELMRLLRGPSSYPEETLPRSNERNSLYLCV